MTIWKNDIIDILKNILSNSAAKDLTDDIWSEINDHTHKSVTGVYCHECGDELKFNVEIDKEMDLTISVHPCKCVVS